MNHQQNMNHQQKLKSIYNLSFLISDIKDIPTEYVKYLSIIADQVYQQKGVYTVLVTLLVHKSLFPEQDIRNHQSGMAGGFSGRTIDTQFITPTLKELGLPSMAESGWLTRSLEQPIPYTLDYPGKISNKVVKESFLMILDYVEKYPHQAENILRLILHKVIEITNKNIVKIAKLKNPDTLTIPMIVSCLEQHFSSNYKTRGGSKLPVLAIYAIYKSLIKEVKRYENLVLLPLGSHHASDLTSQTSGDIEIQDQNGQVFESVEIKHDKPIDITIVRIAYEKIKKFNPTRYYILSHRDVKSEDREAIQKLIETIRQEHGCQVIVNGMILTIQYYLRLINISDFVDEYSHLVSIDSELKLVHKEKWQELLVKINN